MRSRLGVFITAGLSALLTALLTACLNPISVNFPENTSGNVTLPSQKTPDRGISPGIPGGEPFTLDVWVDDAARGIAGPALDQIKYAGIRNIINLVVVDAVTGAIADCQEVRKENEADLNATLVVTGLTYGSTYKFLMLMGHKERDYTAQGVEYKTNPPTLLAAGFKSTSVSRGQKITITMYPVVVDTKFTGGNIPVNAVLGDNPLEADVPWTIAWEVTGLQALKEAVSSGNIFAGAGTIVRGEGIATTEGTPTPAVNDQNIMQISQNVSAYTGTARAGVQNSAAFNVEYVPFSLSETLLNSISPVWIIRNGVNDLSQDEYTTFDSGASWDGTVNGNGAVNFTAVTPFYVSNDGNDNGAGTPLDPFATLTKAYQKALAAPVHKMIVVLSDLDAGNAAMTLDGTTGVPITITSDGGPWTLTRTIGTNGSVVEVKNGAKVVFRDIVINGRPEKDDPNENVYHRALLVQESGTSVTLNNTELTGKVLGYRVSGGGVYVDKGSLTMNSGSTVSGSKAYFGGGVYVDGGSLTMNSGSTVSGNDAYSGGGVWVTVSDGEAWLGAGVWVEGNGSTLTMSGNSKISNNSSFLGGAGVYFQDGVFTMSGTSEISENWFENSDWSSMESAGSSGGGVYFQDGVFTMSGNSKIRNNRATLGKGASGGGVYFLDRWVFTMSGNSEISENTANKEGGGVCFISFNPSSFTMSGNSKIRNNQVVDGAGGGVSFLTFLPSSFTMSGNSEISENTAIAGGGGGVYLHGGVFTMSGNSTIRGNSTKSGGKTENLWGWSSFNDTRVNWNGGGGVYFDYDFDQITPWNFTMKDKSTITGNTAGQDSWGNGGGVYYPGKKDGYFTMKDKSTISGNTATSSGDKGGYGSGVYVVTTTPPGVFDITGGTISGNTGRAGTADFYRDDTE